MIHLKGSATEGGRAFFYTATANCALLHLFALAFVFYFE